MSPPEVYIGKLYTRDFSLCYVKCLEELCRKNVIFHYRNNLYLICIDKRTSIFRNLMYSLVLLVVIVRIVGYLTLI